MHNILFVLLRRLHLPLIVLISVYAISVLGFVLIPGVDDQGNPWRMDFFHAFYFVSFMGTTIGFGELPYEFTDAQRMWTLVTIYGTVTAWLYGIGSLLSVLQDPAIRELITLSSFRRSIRRINEPFYLVCGYGDTGSMLVRALTEMGKRVVVIEKRQERINSLELEDLHMYVPGLCADANDPDNLVEAGLTRIDNRRHAGKNPAYYCIGVAALTNDDAVNLKIAITAKLLNPAAYTIARAETRETESNLRSFDTNYIINPFDKFAWRLSTALHSPGFYWLHTLLTSVPGEVLAFSNKEPCRGKWLLCGFGRFGKAVHARLLNEGMDVTVIEANPEMTTNIINHVIGSGTEEHTLKEAGIDEAVGIVAGTDNDANNLSILMTAKMLNKKLYLVARQNSRRNNRIFTAENLNIDLVMRRGSTIAHTIFAHIQAPLLTRFIEEAEKKDDVWATKLASRIIGVLEDDESSKNVQTDVAQGYEEDQAASRDRNVLERADKDEREKSREQDIIMHPPVVWEITLTAEKAPTLFEVLQQSRTVCLGDILRDPHNLRDPHKWKKRLDCIPLMLCRTEHPSLLPKIDLELAAGDRLLFCGTEYAKQMLDWILTNPNILDYVLTGEDRPSSSIGRWLSGNKRAELP